MLFMQETLWGGAAAGGGPASVSYRTQTADTVDRSSYTFSGRDIGTESSTRRVIVGVAAADTAAITVNSVTVGGIGATEVISNSDDFVGNPVILAALWIADVPTGTTADVVVAFSGTVSGCGIAIWAADNLSSATATATASNDDDPLAMNVNTTADGIVVGLGVLLHSAVSTATWTGPTENFDATVDAGVVVEFSGASAATATASTPMTVTCDWAASGSAAAGVAAAWSAA